MVSSRGETCLDLLSVSRSGVSVVSALVNRGFPCLCLSVCFFISLSGVVCRLCRLLCSVVSHATEQRCVVSHATEQRCVACYRAAFVTEQTCGVVSVAWRFGRWLSSLVSSVLRVCVRPYCALRSFRDDDVDDDDDDECPSVAILAQETSVRFSPQALNTAFYAQ